MFYRKNLYSWEQLLRIVAGLALIAYPVFVIPDGLLRYGLIAGGIGFGLTGVFGYCPMCALAGRRLKAPQEGK